MQWDYGTDFKVSYGSMLEAKHHKVYSRRKKGKLFVEMDKFNKPFHLSCL